MPAAPSIFCRLPDAVFCPAGARTHRSLGFAAPTAAPRDAMAMRRRCRDRASLARCRRAAALDALAALLSSTAGDAPPPSRRISPSPVDAHAHDERRDDASVSVQRTPCDASRRRDRTRADADPALACAAFGADSGEKVCAVLRICSCATPEARNACKVFFSLRTGWAKRSSRPWRCVRAGRDGALVFGRLQKTTGITAVFFRSDVCRRVLRASRRRFRRACPDRQRRRRVRLWKKIVRRSVDSKKKRD
ncbi:hypothetical protein JR065_04540 [Xanthomonas sp. AmX2]|uniref:hypothetical protein n=1 Tax=Xanthomonas sp. TaxID=29446 RepID=UPI001981A559|nr:hypothetical protein [Xanthomonas sp.]MBN6149598.1 hypothetical protein [Xanthomonas sp.]